MCLMRWPMPCGGIGSVDDGGVAQPPNAVAPKASMPFRWSRRDSLFINSSSVPMIRRGSPCGPSVRRQDLLGPVLVALQGAPGLRGIDRTDRAADLLVAGPRLPVFDEMLLAISHRQVELDIGGLLVSRRDVVRSGVDVYPGIFAVVQGDRRGPVDEERDAANLAVGARRADQVEARLVGGHRRHGTGLRQRNAREQSR